MTETTQRGDAYDQYWGECSRPMTDPQEAYRRWEGMDSPLEDGSKPFDDRLRGFLFGVIIGCALGIIGLSIFVTGI